MSKLENNDLIVKLYNYKKELTLEQIDIDRIVSKHIDLFNADVYGRTVSKSNIVKSLNENLNIYTYDNSVVKLLETLNNEIESDSLFYELENLLRVLENNNQGNIYSHAMNIVLEILNESSDDVKLRRILTELKLYEWCEPIKRFIFKYTTNPQDKLNMTSEGGKANPVYSVVEKVDDGLLTFIANKWFILKEDKIEPAILTTYLSETRLQKVLLLEKVLRIAELSEDRIKFHIDEDTSISIGTENGALYLNEVKCNKETNLESIFESPLIPLLRKDMYLLIKETIKNIDKFNELEVVLQLTNITKPHLECYAFNYKGNMYLYSIDSHMGSSFYQYESASLLVNETKQSLGFDLTTFYKGYFDKETEEKNELQNQRKVVLTKLEEISENITKLEDCGLLESSTEIKEAHDYLIKQKKVFETKNEELIKVLTNDYKVLV
jgi:hypothetical protein